LVIKILYLLLLFFSILLSGCDNKTSTDTGGGDNSAPVLSNINNLYGNKDTEKITKIYVTDVDNDQLTFLVASSNSNISALITNDTLTLTPVSNWLGDSNITVTVSDGELSQSVTFNMIVLDVSTPPNVATVDSNITPPPSIPVF